MLHSSVIPAAITGHKDPRMLMRYTHLRTEDLVGRLGHEFLNKTSSSQTETRNYCRFDYTEYEWLLPAH